MEKFEVKNSIWKQVPNFPDYLVNQFGQVWSRKSGKFLAPIKHQSRVNKYLRVGLYSGGIKYRFFVHELVLAAFEYPKPDGLEVDHLDGNTFNNCLYNLEYVTSTENKLRAKQLKQLKQGA